jgi:1-aminocyclopropane-1-carboxylate deaminase
MDNLLTGEGMTGPLIYPSIDLSSLLDPLSFPGWKEQDLVADVLRLDKIHPVLSGNKWFKLKEYLQAARQKSSQTLITFGGAWSNHIIATAFAARQAGLRSIGLIRGERPGVLSATLQEAAACGMQLEFLNRQEYATKENPAFLKEISARYPEASIIPEGGAGKAGITGSMDILQWKGARQYSHILCAIGTGTMFLGLSEACAPGQKLVGIPVLKGMDQLGAIGRDGFPGGEKIGDCRIYPGYHFGGYGRHTPELLNFMNHFYGSTGIPSDFVYTGKLFYAAMDLIRRHLLPAHSRLLLIHSGGLQGNQSLPPGILDF